MPALKNAKHEKFAQLLAKGKTGVDAYLAAGYALEDRKAAGRNAYRLRNRDDIKERLRQIEEGESAIPPPKKKKVGAPSKYRHENVQDVRDFALLGLTMQQIATELSVNPDTLYRWFKDFPEFYEAYQSGKARADARIARSMYQRAQGAEWTEQQAIKVKTGKDTEEIKIVEVRRAVAPAFSAASFWLRNRQPDLWHDKQLVEHTGSIEHQVMQMSPEERRARLSELTERARIINHDEHEFDDADPG